MADIGEETVFNLAEFGEFLIRFFKRSSILVQFKAEDKFSEPKAVKKIIA